MSLNGQPKDAVNVPAFRVQVLGGTFHVSALLVAREQRQEAVRALIEATPADRWFVMVADEFSSEADALAMIDDHLEFQIYAHGVLRRD